MKLHLTENKKGRWYDRWQSSNGKTQSGLTEGDGYPSLSHLKRAIKQDTKARMKFLGYSTIDIGIRFSKSWWIERIKLGDVILKPYKGGKK